MQMTRVITITSAKGGVGKTTLTTNLGLALQELGKSTILVDGNLTTPNVSIHMGLSLFPRTLHDVLKRKSKVDEAIYHHSSGLRVMPAGLSLNDLRGVNSKEFSRVISELMGAADVVLIDASAGLGKESLLSVEVADDLLIVTNPDLPSVTDALKIIKLAQELGTRVAGVIVNRRTGKRHELTNNEIEMMLEHPVVSEIPEDHHVPVAIAAKTPIVLHNPHAPSSYEIRKLAADLLGVNALNPPKTLWQSITQFFR
jgi:septum site-determining protein MinD